MVQPLLECVLTADGGGSSRETWALAKSYAEARKQPGQSQLLDELASRDRTSSGTPSETWSARA